MWCPHRAFFSLLGIERLKATKGHISRWLAGKMLHRKQLYTLVGVERFEVISGLLTFLFARSRWPQSDPWLPRRGHEHNSLFVPFLHDISVERRASPCKDSLSSYQATTFKPSDHKINRRNSLFINCAAYLL
jgi:hypothetical protein